MITITAAAIIHLEKMVQKMEKESQKKGFGIRISMRPYGCNGYGYTIDVLKQEEEGSSSDVAVPLEGASFLCYVDEKYQDALRGMTIDYVAKNLGQSQLVFNNPNVASACGCGESVNIAANKEASKKNV